MGSDHTYPELIQFIKENVLQTQGPYQLVSGASSDYYLDGKQATFHPKGIRLVADAILDEICFLGLSPDSIGGMDMGATPIVSAIALRSNDIGLPVRTFVVRKQAKGHGTKKKIEGLFKKGDEVVMVDDVITTGGSLLQAIQTIKEAGGKVILAISIIDRDGGGQEAFNLWGIPYRPLIKIEELLP